MSYEFDVTTRVLYIFFLLLLQPEMRYIKYNIIALLPQVHIEVKTFMKSIFYFLTPCDFTRFLYLFHLDGLGLKRSHEIEDV